MATESISLSLKRYKGTSEDTQVANSYIGNVYASGSAEHYRVRLAFTPRKRLKTVMLKLVHAGSKNRDSVTYRVRLFTSTADYPAAESGSGSEIAWASDQTASHTFTYDFEAGKTYYIWVWSPSSALGYVVLNSCSATGTVAAPTLYARTSSGWVECDELHVKTGDGWQECDELHTKTSGGWQET